MLTERGWKNHEKAEKKFFLEFLLETFIVNIKLPIFIMIPTGFKNFVPSIKKTFQENSFRNVFVIL